MAKNKERIDTSGKDAELTHNPFAALQSLASTPETAAPTPPPATAPTTTAPAFQVQRTRKGGWPIRLEKRPSGKVVTVISNVTQGADTLLRLLKKQCGAGGVVREDCVEIQGDHRERVESLLARH